MTDEELSGRLLQHFFNLRHNNGGYVPVDDMIISGTEPVSLEVIGSICRRLEEDGLIEWTGYLGQGPVIGTARIKQRGIDIIRPGGEHDINFRFSKKENETTNTRDTSVRDRPDTMSIPTNGEWMSAREALDFLTSRGMNAIDVIYTIRKRARADLIKARAHVLIEGDERSKDVDLPPTFWRAAGDDLAENWDAGDFEWSDWGAPRVEAFGVTFRRQDIEQVVPATAESSARDRARTGRVSAKKSGGRTVFIGHGHSDEWRKLAMFLKDDHGLNVLEFNSSSSAGISTTERLKSMLVGADFAFLILTGEDTQAGGTVHPRLNVVHEAGLFQGKLGFEKAILFLEEGCEGFSNVRGLTHISFPKAAIQTKFHEATRVLKREKLIS